MNPSAVMNMYNTTRPISPPGATDDRCGRPRLQMRLERLHDDDERNRARLIAVECAVHAHAV